jgi:hypothetical protein
LRKLLAGLLLGLGAAAVVLSIGASSTVLDARG